MITERLLDKFKARHPELVSDELDLDGVNSAFELFNEFSANALSETKAAYTNEVTLIKTQIIAINTLVMHCVQPHEPENSVIAADYPASDLHLSAFLTNISNTAQSIYELCLRGFNVQADVLYRTLVERIMQTVILFYNASDMQKWLDAQESEESKQVHFDIFSKKESLHKKYEKILSSLLNITPDIKALRHSNKQKLNEASMSVHGAFSAVVIKSSAFWGKGGDNVTPAIFGSPCVSSRKILEAVSFELWFFFVLFTRILSKRHKWERNYKDKLVLGFELYRYIAHKQFEQSIESQSET